MQTKKMQLKKNSETVSSSTEFNVFKAISNLKKEDVVKDSSKSEKETSENQSYNAFSLLSRQKPLEESKKDEFTAEKNQQFNVYNLLLKHEDSHEIVEAKKESSKITSEDYNAYKLITSEKKVADIQLAKTEDQTATSSAQKRPTLTETYNAYELLLQNPNTEENKESVSESKEPYNVYHLLDRSKNVLPDREGKEILTLAPEELNAYKLLSSSTDESQTMGENDNEIDEGDLDFVTKPKELTSRPKQEIPTMSEDFNAYELLSQNDADATNSQEQYKEELYNAYSLLTQSVNSSDVTKAQEFTETLIDIGASAAVVKSLALHPEDEKKSNLSDNSGHYQADELLQNKDSIKLSALQPDEQQKSSALNKTGDYNSYELLRNEDSSSYDNKTETKAKSDDFNAFSLLVSASTAESDKRETTCDSGSGIVDSAVSVVTGPLVELQPVEETHTFVHELKQQPEKITMCSMNYRPAQIAMKYEDAMQEESSPSLELENDVSSFAHKEEVLLPLKVVESPASSVVKQQVIKPSKSSMSVEVLSKMQVSVDFNKSPALSAEESSKNEILLDVDEEKKLQLDTQDNLDESEA